MRKRLYLAKGIVAACAMLPTLALAANHLSVAVRQSIGDSRSGRPYVTVHVVNDGDVPLWILPSQTAFDLDQGHMSGRWFEFDPAQGAVPFFEGRQLLIRDPSPSSYVRLDPRESRSVGVDLSADYHFPTDATYNVRTTIASYTSIPLPGSDDVGGLSLSTSDFFPISVSAAYVTPFSPLADNVVPCTDEQVTQIGQARYKATNASGVKEMLLDLSYYYDPIDPSDPDKPRRKHMKRDAKYVYWLGEWDDDAPQPPEPDADATDNAKVDATVHATVTRFRQGFNIVCDLCPRNDPATRAWTDGTGTVHLCPENFRDPVIGGISSQTATLIHEATHIVDQHGPATVDIPGVTSRATAHALDRPKAVISGANYEYFIANTPLGLTEAD